MAQKYTDIRTIDMASRAEADQVLHEMDEILSAGGVITVQDYCSVVGIKCEHDDDLRGWRSVNGMRVVRTSHGFMVELPEPESLQ